MECNKGHADEKKYFAKFVRELSEAFKPRGLLLSSAVSPSKTVIDAGYEVETLSKYFDWIAVMAYDYHGQWDKQTGNINYYLMLFVKVFLSYLYYKQVTLHPCMLIRWTPIQTSIQISQCNFKSKSSVECF